MRSTDNRNHTKLPVYNGGNALFSLSDTNFPLDQGTSPVCQRLRQKLRRCCPILNCEIKKSDTLLPEWNAGERKGSVTVIVGLLHTIQRPFRTHSVNSYIKSCIRPEPPYKAERKKLNSSKVSFLICLILVEDTAPRGAVKNLTNRF